MKSTRYPELKRVKWTPNWVFRKYSSAKGSEFSASTGIPAVEKSAAEAYKKGLEAFNEWLGSRVDTSRPVLIRDLVRAVLSTKENAKGGMSGRTYKTAKNQAENHVGPAFGHLRPDQLTSLKWEQWISDEIRKGRRRQFFNSRKLLREVLGRAQEEGLIRQVPKLKLSDKPAEPPKYLTAAIYRRIRRALSWPVKLLVFVMYYQGPRPNEAMQYRWDMIRWNEGPHGSIHIPGEITKTGRARVIPLNSRVSRAFRYLKARSPSRFIFPGRDPERPLSAYNAVWDRLREKQGHEFTIYNMRDTFITNRLKAGVSSTFIGKYCDTSPTMIERKYAVAEQEVMTRTAG